MKESSHTNFRLVVLAQSMIRDFGFWRFEITYIIDRKGIVQFKDSGITSTETLREELNKLL